MPVVLADGQEWLLATPIYRASVGDLTQPAIDSALDRIFDCLVLNEGISLCDVWGIAVALLKVNYDLTDDELSALLSVVPGAESRRLASAVLEATFSSIRQARTYCRWVGASLLANGLSKSEIPTHTLHDVLAILVATKRTVPVSQFVDACMQAHERESLESLI